MVSDLVLRTVRAAIADPAFAMVETASLTAEAAWLRLQSVSIQIDATGACAPDAEPRANIGRCR